MFDVKLGRTYLALGQPDRALKAVAQLQSLQPELPWPHLIAGQALLEKGQPSDAIAALERSLGTNPFDPSVHCALAEAYQRLPAGTGVPEPRRTRAPRSTVKICAPSSAADPLSGLSRDLRAISHLERWLREWAHR